ncbi:hypothetical protein SLEP1_g19172 [Rubroshorea leprosula]|nr:hypothetical protein SLEP1_g19172 [Rubroshorea leprosula]
MDGKGEKREGIGNMGKEGEHRGTVGGLGMAICQDPRGASLQGRVWIAAAKPNPSKTVVATVAAPWLLLLLHPSCCCATALPLLHRCCAIAPPLLCHCSATDAPLLRHNCYCTTAAVVAQSRSGSVYLDILVGNEDPRSRSPFPARNGDGGKICSPSKIFVRISSPSFTRTETGTGTGRDSRPCRASLTSLGKMPPSPRLNS